MHFTLLQHISIIMLRFVGNVLAFWNGKRLSMSPVTFKPHDSLHTRTHFADNKI
jgi:hypothetical protein